MNIEILKAIEKHSIPENGGLEYFINDSFDFDHPPYYPPDFIDTCVSYYADIGMSQLLLSLGEIQAANECMEISKENKEFYDHLFMQIGESVVLERIRSNK